MVHNAVQLENAINQIQSVKTGFVFDNRLAIEILNRIIKNDMGKTGIMEKWNDGRALKDRNTGILEGWKDMGNDGKSWGIMEGWRDGRVERPLGMMEYWNVGKTWRNGGRMGRGEGKQQKP